MSSTSSVTTSASRWRGGPHQPHSSMDASPRTRIARVQHLFHANFVVVDNLFHRINCLVAIFVIELDVHSVNTVRRLMQE